MRISRKKKESKQVQKNVLLLHAVLLFRFSLVALHPNLCLNDFLLVWTLFVV